MHTPVEHVRSFSSFTKGLYSVQNIEITHDAHILTLLLPAEFHAKLLKRFAKFPCSIISIDGVAAEVKVIKDSNTPEHFEVIAKVAKDILSKTALDRVESESKVSLGMMSKNPEKWLIDGSPIGKVYFVSDKIADGHEHTKELTFECSEAIFQQIKELQYIGVNGSGLFVREPQSVDGRFYFSIHAGRDTREKTVFGKEDLTKEMAFTITLPVKESPGQ